MRIAVVGMPLSGKTSLCEYLIAKHQEIKNRDIFRQDGILEEIIRRRDSACGVRIPSSVVSLRHSARPDLPFPLFSHTAEESDARIVEIAGCTIPEIFKKQGESAFREMERAVLSEYLDRTDVIVFTGGGAVVSAESRKVLARYDRVIYLDVTPETLIQRLTPDEIEKRPLLGTEEADAAESLKRLFREREPLYREVATDVLNADSGNVEETATRLLCLLREYEQGTLVS